MDEIQEFGSKLKQVREAKGISLEDVQAATKIPIDALRSIEREEKVTKISPIYAKGFLKIYAKFLGVEFPFEKRSTATTHYFEPAEKDKKLKKDFAPSFSNKIDFVLWAKIIITLIILLALINFAVKLSHRRKPIQKEIKVVKVVTVNAPAATQPSKVSQIKLAVRAKDNTWLSVKRDGKTVFYQVLRRGTSKSWIAKDRFELSIGNAAALELWFNDKIISPLGKKGQALKNVVINKDGLSAK